MAFTISSDTSDDTLIAELHRLIRHERNATARVIAHLAEVERRRIHLAAGFPSMFAYFPQEDVPTCVRKVPIAQRSGTSIATAALPMTTTPEEAAPPPIPAPSVALPPSPPSPPRRAEIRALAAERHHVSFTASTATIEKLREAKDLLGHAVPSGDVAEVVERALDALLKQLTIGNSVRPRVRERWTGSAWTTATSRRR
jgi:hypothetical protein